MKLPTIERQRREIQALKIYLRQAMQQAGAAVLEARFQAWEQATEVNRLRDLIRPVDVCVEYQKRRGE